MQIFLFDNQAESALIWQKLATPSGYELTHEKRWLGIEHLPSEYHVIVLDRSAVPNNYAMTVSQVAMARPSQVVVATATDWTVGEIVQIMRQGVDYVFEKPLDGVLVDRAFPEIMTDARKLREKLSEYEALQELFTNLTHRERDVLDCVMEGVSNRDSAEQLNVSVRTIEARRAKVYGKTQSNSVVDLVRKVDRLARLSQIFDTTNRSAELRIESRQLAGPWYRRNRGSLLVDEQDLVIKKGK